MLSLEYLLEEAKENGLPILKKRGILREYLQVIVLNSIYKHKFGKHMFFTGETALRFFYNMPRFSEDLDFDASRLSFEEFKEIMEYVKKELLKEGFSPEISSEKRASLYVAELNFKDIMKLYNITDERGLDLMIKIEVFKPSWKLKSESSVLSLYGYSFSATLLERGCMFSEKLYALFNRKRARDIYDTLFMLRKKFPLKDSSCEAILAHLKGLSDKELKLLANQFRPFLFKEDDIELVLNAPLYAEKFISSYRY